jgi:hypothetical protein
MTKLTAKGAATRQRIIEGAAGVIREAGVGDTTLDGEPDRHSPRGRLPAFALLVRAAAVNQLVRRDQRRASIQLAWCSNH